MTASVLQVRPGFLLGGKEFAYAIAHMKQPKKTVMCYLKTYTHSFFKKFLVKNVKTAINFSEF